VIGECIPHGDMRNIYKVFVRKLEGKRPLGRLRRRWKVNVRETG
jgi:hypothetical protein